MNIKKTIVVLAFIFCISAFFMPSIILASTGDIQETLTVNAVWVEGEMLQIDVTNINTGQQQKLELRLKDYTDDSEYVSIQAVDLDGNKSNIVQIKNPYYKPAKQETVSNSDSKNNVDKTSESAISTGKVPFTPDGTGEVMDNVKGGDGKEFFTIKTQNNNVFHLIIDHQRNSDNVYLLNAVTEADLMALAEKSGDTISAIPTPEPEKTIETPTPAPEPEETKSVTNNNTGMFILIGFAMLIIGGISYYFKIYKPKHETTDIENDDNIDENDEDYEYKDEVYEDEQSDDEETDKGV